MTRAESIFFYLCTFHRCAVCHVFFLKRKHSTIVEGQRLGTVHIMEGTCSRLRFFVKKYEHRHVHIHIHIHNYVQKQVRVRGWVVGCVVGCVVVRCVVVEVSLCLGILKLKSVRSKGFFR